MAAQLDSAKLPVRAIITLPAIFASGSLMIAIIGQYAVVAFSMRRRTRDFGVRMALGASLQHILSSVLGEGMRLTVVGQAYAEAAEGYKYFLRFRDLDRDAVGGMVLLRGLESPGSAALRDSLRRAGRRSTGQSEDGNEPVRREG